MKLFQQYYKYVDCFRLDDAMDELHTFLKEDELREIPVLILANKQDLDGAKTPEDITQVIQDKNVMRDRNWAVFGVIAKEVKGNGLLEAFDWLTNEMVNNERNKVASALIQGANTKTKNNNTNKSDNNDSDKISKPFYCSLFESFKKMIM